MKYDLKLSVEGGTLKSELYPFREDTVYVLCPYGIGDTLYVLGFMKAYREKHQEKRLGFIVKESHKCILKWFSGTAGGEIVSSDLLVKMLNHFIVMNSLYKLDNLLYGHFHKDRNYNLLSEYFEIPEKKILPRYSKLIFGFEEDVQFEYPRISRCDGISVDNGGFSVDEKTVIFAPYAKSSIMLPIEFWEILAGTLQHLGMNVLTNVADGEVPIKNTRSLSLDLGQFTSVCSKARAVIAVRSGLCDAVAFTDVMLFVINMSDAHYYQWNLNDVVSRSGIFNYLCDSNEKFSMIAQEIVEKLITR